MRRVHRLVDEEADENQGAQDEGRDDTGRAPAIVDLNLSQSAKLT